MPMKPDITNASDALWSAAVERERVIATLATASQVSRSEVEGAAQELELSRAMVYRLVARYRRDPHTSALLSHSPGRRAGTRILGERMEQILAQAIKTFFLTPERPSVTALHRVVSSECKKAGQPAPSYNTIRARVKAESRRSQGNRSSPCRPQGCSRSIPACFGQGPASDTTVGAVPNRSHPDRRHRR